MMRKFILLPISILFLGLHCADNKKLRGNIISGITENDQESSHNPSDKLRNPLSEVEDKLYIHNEFIYFLSNLFTLLLQNLSFPPSSDFRKTEVKLENFTRRYNGSLSFQDFVSFTIKDDCGEDVDIDAILENIWRNISINNPSPSQIKEIQISGRVNFSLSWVREGKKYIANGRMLYKAYYPASVSNTTFPFLPTYVDANLEDFLIYINSDLLYTAMSVKFFSPFSISTKIENDIKGKISIEGLKMVSGDKKIGCSYSDGITVITNLLWKNFEFGKTFFPENISIDVKVSGKTESKLDLSAVDECSGGDNGSEGSTFLCGVEKVKGKKFQAKHICFGEKCNGEDDGGIEGIIDDRSELCDSEYYRLECVEQKIYREGITYAIVFDRQGKKRTPPLIPVRYTISYLQVNDECKNLKTNLGDEVLLSLYIDNVCRPACTAINLFDGVIVNKKERKISAIISPKKAECPADKERTCPAFIKCSMYIAQTLLPSELISYDISVEIYADEGEIKYLGN